ncbi:MAG: MFS transporter [Planctomycetes bacterium]|nr:MFS transporter [Planctomycetota bacterium]
MRSLLRKLPFTVWLVGFTSLFNDAASEMLYPVLPIYIGSVLGAGPGGLGLIEGVADATSSLLKLFSGIAVDRTRRAKPWIVLGYSVAAVMRPLLAVAGSWPVVLCIRFADRLGKGLRSAPRDEILTVTVPPDRRGLAFGVHRALDNAGAVAGPIACWLLLENGATIRSLFFIAIVPGAIAVLLTLMIREPARERAPKPPAVDLSMDGFSLQFKRYLVAVGLFALGCSSNMFLLLRARELGVAESRVPLLWAAVSLVAAVLSAPLSSLSDRLGRRGLMAAGWIAYALFYVAMAFLDSAGPALVLLFMFYGVFAAMTEGVEKALVADFAPRGRAGAAFGWFHCISGILLLPASLVFGLLYHAFGPSVAFLFSAGCAVAAVGALILWVGKPALKPG